MPSIYDLKPRFQNLLRPLSHKLAKWGITANQVTLTAAALSVLLGIALWLGHDHTRLYLLVPVFMLFRMGLNAIDGMLAREHDMKTPFGAILNELGDVISDCFLYLPFALIPAINNTLMVIIVQAAVISEMTGVIAVQIGADRRYDGPMGKSDRAFAFGVIALLTGLGVSMGPWINLILLLMLILLAITIRNRITNAIHQRGR